MPQLDKFAFHPQVFWLVLVFFLVYFYILHFGLPTLYKILFFRKKQVDFYYLSSCNLAREYLFVKVSNYRFFYALSSLTSSLAGSKKLIDYPTFARFYPSYLFLELTSATIRLTNVSE